MIIVWPFLIIIVLLIAFIGYRDYMDRVERKQLIRSIMAKNLTEAVQAEALDKQEPIIEKEPDIVPLETMDQTDFDKMIKKQLNKADNTK
jgi:hypothetical protein